MKLYISTGNPGKLKELDSMVREYFPEFTTITGQAAKHAPETESTFLGNAKIKAHCLRKEILSLHPGEQFAVLSDDSGLCVDALNGAPGVQSARYAGDHVDSSQHIQKLLMELEKSGANELPKRQAHYTCALVLLVNQGSNVISEYTAEGECHGIIGHYPSGDSGFGYDPVFLMPELGKTFSEIPYEQKNKFSHRQNAFKALRENFLKNKIHS